MVVVCALVVKVVAVYEIGFGAELGVFGGVEGVRGFMVELAVLVLAVLAPQMRTWRSVSEANVWDVEDAVAEGVAVPEGVTEHVERVRGR